MNDNAPGQPRPTPQPTFIGWYLIFVGIAIGFVAAQLIW